MSLILEALKKAERQHKLGEVPGIRGDMVDTQPAGLRGLGWMMLLLFACLMLGLGLYLGGFRLPMSAQTAQTQAASPAPATPLPAAATPEPMPPVQPAAATPPPAEPEPAVAETTPPPKPVAPPPKAQPPKPLSEMPSGFAAHLPSLNIDIHSYDERSSKRYVLINMEKYREGDYLAEGPQLIEILPGGVVLDYLGQRFIMPIGNQ
ncbi:MAG: general secretion pathway protein GspB [Candidatus Thiodiazotropha sp.]